MKIKRIITFICCVLLTVSAFALESSAIFSLGKPSGLKVSAVSADSVTLSWKKVISAESYEVYEKVDGKWSAIGDTENINYSISNLAASKSYEFAVRSINVVGKKKYYSDKYSTVSVKTNDLEANVLLATAGADYIKLSWSKAAGATGYKIYMKKGDSWKVVKKLSADKLKYTVKNLEYNSTYQFAVKPFTSADGNGTEGPASNIIKIKTFKANKVKVKVKKSTATTVTLSWSKADQATGYKIYRCEGDKLKTVATINSVNTLSKVIKSLRSDTVYTFKVRAFRKSGSSTVWFVTSSSCKAITDPVSKNLTLYRTNNLKGIFGGKNFTLSYSTENKKYGNIPVTIEKKGSKYKLYTKVNELEYVLLNAEDADYIMLPQRKGYIKLAKSLSDTVDIKSLVDDLLPGKNWKGKVSLATFNGKKVVCEEYTNKLKTKTVKYYYRAGELVGIEEYNATGKLVEKAVVTSVKKSAGSSYFKVPSDYKKIA